MYRIAHHSPRPCVVMCVHCHTTRAVGLGRLAEVVTSAGCDTRHNAISLAPSVPINSLQAAHRNALHGAIGAERCAGDEDDRYAHGNSVSTPELSCDALGTATSLMPSSSAAALLQAV